MSNQRISEIKSQTLIGASLLLAALWLAYRLGEDVASGDVSSVAFAAAVGVGGAALLFILKNWRRGFYVFFVWLMFEDLVRKYMGNGLAFFFGKDILLLCIYFAFYIEVRRGREKTFRPPFLLFLSLFFWLGVLQLFNPYSPHILYGLLGLKLYFFYVPLLFVGYAMINSDEDLGKFLVINSILVAVVSAVGIIQGILGNSFLNPRTLAPELEGLGDLSKATPLTNMTFSLPPSVFVSSGRFAQFLIVSFMLMFGSAAYFLVNSRRSRLLVFGTLGLTGVATILSGSRSALLWTILTAVVLSVAMLWGAGWDKNHALRISKALRRSVLAGTACIALLIVAFPKEAGSRLTYYSETLLPNSSAYQLSFRTWNYPLQELESAFNQGNWLVGHGVGTASLGIQYVAKLLKRPPLGLGVENGYGSMIIEMGILAPILWILWTAVMLYFCWKVIRQLRGTRFFPVAIAFVWYAFTLLYPDTFGGLPFYQNYISNAYFWLLTGMLFRLPTLVGGESAAIATYFTDSSLGSPESQFQ